MITAINNMTSALVLALLLSFGSIAVLEAAELVYIHENAVATQHDQVRVEQ